MIYGTAAGHPSRQVYSVSFDPLYAALAPWILILSYYHGMGILPQEQDDLILTACICQIFFHSKIDIWIRILSSVYCKLHSGILLTRRQHPVAALLPKTGAPAPVLKMALLIHAI